MTEPRGESALSWLEKRCDAFGARIDRAFAVLERRLGAWGASLAFGLLLLALAAVYTAPAFRLINHGISYGEFARDPFQDSPLTASLRFRPLSPFVAHYMFLRGQAFIAFPLLAAVGLLALIIRTCRRRGYGASESVAMAATLAFTSPILFTLHFAGYVDVVSYLFMGIAVAAIGSDLLVGVCVCLLLLNHDSNLFILVWLVFHAARKRPSWARRARLALAVGVALTVVWLVRGAIAARAPVAWEPSFYLNWAYLRENALLNVRGAWLGLFMCFKLLWLIPIFAAVDLAVKKRYAALFDLCLAVICGVGTLLITSDVSRLPSMAFPALLGGAAVLRKDVLAPPRFGRALWLLIALNLLVPQYYVGQSKPVVFFPLPVALVLKACGYDPWDDWLGLRVMHFSQE